MAEQPHIRLAPEPLDDPLPDGEAIDRARDAHRQARRNQMALYAGSGRLNGTLFDAGTVTYRKLRQMYHEAREQADRAQAVAVSLEQALEAMEATRPDYRPSR